MAAAMNQVGYDAAALGNHEFNYGLDPCAPSRSSAASRCWRPTRWTGTRAPGLQAVDDEDVKLPGGKPITVGILGLATPGVAIWDAANVEGKVRFPGIVEQAKVMVPASRRGRRRRHRVRHSAPTLVVGRRAARPGEREGADGRAGPGIDAILVGHAHQEIPERHVTNMATGEQVLLSEPLYWGMRVTRMTLDCRRSAAGGRS